MWIPRFHQPAASPVKTGAHGAPAAATDGGSSGRKKGFPATVMAKFSEWVGNTNISAARVVSSLLAPYRGREGEGALELLAATRARTLARWPVYPARRRALFSGSDADFALHACNNVVTPFVGWIRPRQSSRRRSLAEGLSNGGTSMPFGSMEIGWSSPSLRMS